MKKFIALLLSLTMVFAFTACGDKEEPGTEDAAYTFALEDYSEYILADYVTLPDYDSYSGYSIPEVTVTDDEIDAEIQSRLDAAATTQTVTEGIVNEGDTINIEFHGTLKDGSSPDGMNTDDTQITLGSAGYIDGFESGLYGHQVGETVTLDLRFPDDYAPEENEASAYNGQDVTFVVTILSMEAKIAAELNQDFISEDTNGECKKEAEYRTFIKNDLTETKKSDALYSIKSEIYNKIVEEAVVNEVIQDKIDSTYTVTYNLYEKMAGLYGYDLETFRTEQLGMDEDAFKEYVMEYTESTVKNRMVIFALWQKEGLTGLQEEYDKEMVGVMTNAGVTTPEEFENSNGFSVEEYSEMYSLCANVALDLALDQIIERIVK